MGIFDASALQTKKIDNDEFRNELIRQVENILLKMHLIHLTLHSIITQSTLNMFRILTLAYSWTKSSNTKPIL